MALPEPVHSEPVIKYIYRPETKIYEFPDVMSLLIAINKYLPQCQLCENRAVLYIKPIGASKMLGIHCCYRHKDMRP